MRLTQYTDFALRMLMLLALEPDEIHTVEEVARRYEISRHHLTKVAQRLVQTGFVCGLRGRGGGLRLALLPQEINLGAVVRATEDNFALVECFDKGRNQCVVTAACSLRGPLEDALHAFLRELDKQTLADLLKSPGTNHRMRRLLAEKTPAAV